MATLTLRNSSNFSDLKVFEVSLMKQMQDFKGSSGSDNRRYSRDKQKRDEEVKKNFKELLHSLDIEV